MACVRIALAICSLFVPASTPCRRGEEMAPGITIAERHRGPDLTGGWSLEGFDVEAFVTATLAEDLGELGDITSAAVIPADARFTGVMDSRDAIIVAGLTIAEAFFRRIDPK